MGGVFWINSKLFDAQNPRPEAVNESIGGDELANWLSARLRESGVDAGEPFAEDHGWDFSVKKNGADYLVSCACEIKAWGTDTPEHVIALTKMRGFMDRMRGRNGFMPDDALKSAIARILASDQGIENVRWEDDAR